METSNTEESDGGVSKTYSNSDEIKDNIENITIKEEVLSDLEPECLLSVEENVKIDLPSQSNMLDMTYNSEEKSNDTCNESIISTWQTSSQNQELSNEESLVTKNKKTACSHDKENFKIVKKKVRCGNCKLIVCPECCKALNSPLQNHFSGSNKNNSNVYSCKRCHLIFHSSCSLQAHTRLHLMSTPYVCPDCGMIYNNIYFLVKHLMNKCQHVYKVLRYKCKICPSACFTSEIFVKHIHAHHIEFVFRCLFCSIMFRNSDEFIHHMQHIHPNEKVQNINYFQCSLCSNMVFPRSGYEKHIAQHQNSPEAYEIEYQCPCGYVYSFPGAFRDHIKDCSKKGILPAQWSFLENKLEAQDVLQMEKTEGKNVLVHELENNSNASAASSIRKLSVINSSGKTVSKSDEDKIQNIELLVDNKVILKSDLKNTRNATVSFSIKKIADAEESCISQDDKTHNNDVSVKPSTKLPNHSFSPKDMKTSEIQILNCSTECFSKTDDLEVGNSKLKINEVTNIQLKEKYSKETAIDVDFVNKEKTDKNIEVGQSDSCSKETKQIITDSSKMIYDHIPCDHLGYVIKTQYPHLSKNESEVCEISNLLLENKSLSLKDCHIVTELDEKTGLILTKQVPIESNAEERNENEKMVEEIDKIYSGNADQNMYNNDKSKFKPSNSFFMCPFCVVVFPKQGSTFQQFKLHVESYHPDAALDVVIDTNENKNFENTETYLGAVSKNLDLQNNSRVRRSIIKSLRSKSTLINEKENGISSNIIDNKHSLENGQDRPDIYTIGERRVSDKREKEDLTKEVMSVVKGINENMENPCWSVELSIQRNDTPKEKKQSVFFENEGSKSAKSEKFHLNSVPSTEIETTSQTFEVQKLKTYKKKLSSIRKDDNKETKLRDLKQSNEEPDDVKNVVRKNESDTYTFNYYDTKNKEEDDVVFLSSSERKSENKPRMIHSNEEENRKNFRLSSDFENYCETSKDSNWSDTSDIKIMNLTEESKGEEKEKSTREGEVWSELYESLMLAEKFKKNKNKNMSPDSDEKKKLVTSDFSAKRVVKKPKRYRESSDSNDSDARNENSDSDGDFLNIFQSTECKTETCESDDLLSKKQKLLDKLQNADDSFLDYLYDIINRKEKCFELYKKHSTLRTSRYSQDLRSYRKKVLNGIKQRGKHQKLLRYQDLLKKKSPSQSGENKYEICSETSYQPVQKNSKLISHCTKSGERKRGRPRKICDLAKVQERRRSDKEVVFIQKNFERRENDFSPSKRKRKLSSKLQYYKKIYLVDEKDDFASGQVITNKYAESAKKLNCAVCKEVFPDVIEFREHVLTHRMEENSYQCMECGECFVVRPSLEKHLHAFHKIKNTEKYITENECCNLKKEVTEVEREPLKENQCKVCKDQFDRAIDLTKHFRIHGMAFLKEFKKDSKPK